MSSMHKEYESYLKDESVKIATYIVNKRLGTRQKSYKIGEKLYELCSEMENEREPFFGNVCTRLNLNRDNISESSKAVMDNIFEDGCNFGRIVALFTFCLTLSIYCAENDELADQKETVINNTAITLVKQREWFENEGSWSGFVEHFTTPEEKIWKGFVITTVGLSAVAGLLYVNS